LNGLHTSLVFLKSGRYFCSNFDKVMQNGMKLENSSLYFVLLGKSLGLSSSSYHVITFHYSVTCLVQQLIILSVLHCAVLMYAHSCSLYFSAFRIRYLFTIFENNCALNWFFSFPFLGWNTKDII
jgi:hypothetical protein